tara:strand:+ start:408 stop:818 length:411 start_codon:yes stop_codon:yes gene_type:complete
MAHYAFLDENNQVVEVIVGIDENDTSELPEGFSSWEEWYGDFKGMTCKRTSYNTIDGEHKLGGTPFRGTYAGIGGFYDEAADKFYRKQPYPSWTLDSDLEWQPPIAEPADSDTVQWMWDEGMYQADNTTGWRNLQE